MSSEQSPPVVPTATADERAEAVTRRARRPWTSSEDQTLKERVAHYNSTRGGSWRWREIAQAIPGRTAKDCRKRWLHSLDPSLRKGRWTKEEDRILLDAYSRLGPAWNEIARLIPGRKDDQCSKRHRDILAPLAKNRLFDWTPEEDQILRDGVRDLGHRWTSVAARLPGRPPLTCRNRWRNLCKHEAVCAAGSGPQGGGGQPAGESSAVSQSASPAISREGDGLDTQFNIEDFITAEDYGMASSATNASPVASCPDVPDLHYAPLPLSHGYDAEPAADNDLLATPTNLEDLPGFDLNQPYHRRLGSSMVDTGSSLPDVPIPVDPMLGTGEPTVQQGVGQPGQAPEAAGSSTGQPNYRSLELASELSVNKQRPSAGSEPGGGVGDSGSSMTPAGAEGHSLHSIQSHHRDTQMIHQHNHYHHYHHHHHYYHHHHYHHHFH